MALKPLNVTFMEKRLETLELIDEIRAKMESSEYEF